LIAHNVSTTYLAIPIVLWVFLKDFQNNKFNSIQKIFLYFFLPFLIFHFFLEF
jgi:predicted permease